MELLQGGVAQTGGCAAGLLSGDRGEVVLIISLQRIFIYRSLSEEMVNRFIQQKIGGKTDGCRGQIEE